MKVVKYFKSCLSKKKFWLLVALSVILCLVLLRFGSKRKFDDELLIDISSISVDNKEQKNIFFIEDSCFTHCKSVRLNTRQACSIESAALMNPAAHIAVVFVTNTMEINKSEAVLTLMRYENVKLYQLDFIKFTLNTPADDWIKSGKLFHTPFLYNNIANILRLLLIWKFGGSYLDLDVISLVSIDTIPYQNYVCAQVDNLNRSNALNNAILSLNGNKGRNVAEMFIRDFMLNYDGHKWGHNGPDMITRVAKSLCDLKGSIKEPLNCTNLTILPKTKCYEIGYYEWKHFYDIKHAANDMQRLKESYFVHFWNKMNQLEKLQSFTNSSTPYVQLAKKFCPKVFTTAGSIF